MAKYSNKSNFKSMILVLHPTFTVTLGGKIGKETADVTRMGCPKDSTQPWGGEEPRPGALSTLFGWDPLRTLDREASTTFRGALGWTPC